MIEFLKDNADLQDVIKKVNELVKIKNEEFEAELERLRTETKFLKAQIKQREKIDEMIIPNYWRMHF